MNWKKWKYFNLSKNKMAIHWDDINCEVCDKKGCFVATEGIVTKKRAYFCCRDCANSAILLEEYTFGIEFYTKEIRALTKLRDSIKENPEEWKIILPFVYGWLMFYLAVKRRDTRTRLKRLFDLALKKNQEVFSEVDGNKEFKEKNPHVFNVLTKYLVKANQDKTEHFIDLFATPDSLTETI